MGRSVNAFVTDAMWDLIEEQRAKKGLNRSRYCHSLIVKGIAYELGRLAKYDSKKQQWEVEE